MHNWKSASNELLLSLVEELNVFNNIRMEMNLTEQKLMVMEHHSIINEDSKPAFNANLEKIIFSLLQKAKELIGRLVDWFNQKFLVFVKKIKRQQPRKKFNLQKSDKIVKAKIDIASSSIKLTKFFSDLSANIMTINYNLATEIAKLEKDVNGSFVNISSKISSSRDSLNKQIKKVKDNKDMSYSFADTVNILQSYESVSKLLTERSEEVIKKQISLLKTYHNRLKVLSNKRTANSQDLYRVCSTLGVFISEVFSFLSQMLVVAVSVSSEAERVLGAFSESK